MTIEFCFLRGAQERAEVRACWRLVWTWFGGAR